MKWIKGKPKLAGCYLWRAGEGKPEALMLVDDLFIVGKEALPPVDEILNGEWSEAPIQGLPDL